MSHHLLLGYIILYGVLTLGTFALYALVVPKEEKVANRAWETALDVLLAATAFAGMIFLLKDFRPQGLPTAWRVVSVVLVASQLIINLRARSRRERGPEDETPAQFADLTTLIVLPPSLALNLIYAFR